MGGPRDRWPEFSSSQSGRRPHAGKGCLEQHLSTIHPREPPGWPHSHGVHWAFHQTLQTEWEPQGSQGKCWDQLTWPRGPLAFQPGLALGQDGGGLWVQVSAGWWMNLASLLTAPKGEGSSHTGNLPAILGSPAVSPTPFQALPPQP